MIFLNLVDIMSGIILKNGEEDRNMNKLIKFLKNECRGWSVIEVLWLCVASTVILGLSLYWKEGALGIIMAVSGVVCVILTGKGKISSYIFGTINTVLYAYVALKAHYYGEVMLNMIYYFPMNFIGWFLWKGHMNEDTKEIIKERLKPKYQAIMLAACCICIYVYGLILKMLGGNLPFVDSMSTVVSIFAQILCVRRYMEQWILWIIVDVVTIIMWTVDFLNGGETIATLLMWIIYLINAIIMFVKWNNESKKVTSI